MSTILLKFAGPLQSWGTRSHFETRHTDMYPSKSAVIGVIAASLGLSRDDDEQIRRLNQLDFAVRVEQVGNLLRDYHTARKYDSDGKFKRTYVTNRYYLEDYIFIVGLSHEDEEWLSEIESALKSPHFQPFMGRRSNPLTLDFFLGRFDDSLMSMMRTFNWQAAEWYKRKWKNADVTLELYVDSYLSDRKAKSLRRDRVVSFSQKERKFGYRYETREIITLINEVNRPQMDEHDILNAIGD